jgi:predicted flavoprotein YhiN
MKYDVVIIGGGAAGLLAAHGAKTASPDSKVLIVEKMPRPGRKILFTGKGRCNFTNVKEWNDFSTHIRSNPNFVKPAYYNFTPDDIINLLESNGLETVVERGDRAFPYSHRASDVVDTLVQLVLKDGVMLLSDREVKDVLKFDGGFSVLASSGEQFDASKLIIATGGLSYPGTGSTGDGYIFAKKLGHSITPTFPSLTALVPRGYKVIEKPDTQMRGHIDRGLPMTAAAQALAGAKLKNISLTVFIDGQQAESEFGDVDFTDGGIEGPIGFQVSRHCVKAMMNGSKVSVSLDLKAGVPLEELSARIHKLWEEIENDPRTKGWKDGRGLNDKEKYRILLGKLMPWEFIPGFQTWNPEILKVENTHSDLRSRNTFFYQARRRGNFPDNRHRMQRRSYSVDLDLLAKRLKDFKFDIDGYVGYERCVVTAGGVSTDEVFPKTMESRITPGLYLCGEVLDMDCDTGGYNLQCAFSTGYLAGQSAAKAVAE